MQSTVNPIELAKFAEQAENWWDKDGPLKTLHDINPARLSFIRKYQDITDKRILDVGCGGGILSESLQQAGAKVTAIDAEKKAIAMAKAHAKSQNLNIAYYCSTIENFENPCFDSITCMEMLEHVSHPEVVISHCAHLLKPQGLLFLSTLNRSVKAYVSAIFGAEYVLGLLPRQTHDFDKFIKPSELASMLRDSDFEILAISGLHYNPFTRTSTLQEDVSVNYLVAAVKAGE